LITRLCRRAGALHYKAGAIVAGYGKAKPAAM
jgi:hypothetical protein